MFKTKNNKTAKTTSSRHKDFFKRSLSLVLPLEKYKIPNFRLDGLRKLQVVNAPIPSPIYIISNETFRFYKNSPEECMKILEKEILNPAMKVASLSKKGTITLRRAYDIPGLANPEGPRFLGLKPNELATGVKQLFDFAIERRYDLVPNSQIACFFYFFTDPENKPLEEIKRNDILPYGGHVIPLTKDGTRFQILATWGNNETLILYESEHKPVETYDIEVDSKNLNNIRILKKTIVPKEIMHYTTKEGKNAVVAVPLSHQLEQVMYDSGIVDVARSVTLLMHRYGPQKVEFSSDGDRVLFNESTNIERELELPKPGQTFVYKGKIFIVSSIEDVKELSKLSKKELSHSIVYAIDRKRGSPTNNMLAKTFENKPLVILYSGTSRTAHAMKIFSDMNHLAFPVGQQEFLNDDLVNIQVENSIVNIKNLTAEQLKEAVPLDVAFKRGVNNVGGKAERISYLKTKGFNIPSGIVLTTDFFDEVLYTFKADKLLTSLTDNPPKEPKNIERAMRQAIPYIPDKLWQKTIPLFNRSELLSTNKRVIVRSSANVEDLRSHSFAGVFESIANQVGEEKICRAILECIYSTFTPSVIHYLGLENLNKLLDIKLAIIVQELVDARISGTAFGGDPQTKDTHVVLIEAKHGFGSEIVEGGSVGERLLLTKEKGEFKLREGQRLLTESEETFLFLLVQRLEDEFGYPQDIEWSIDTNNRFWILQVRDL